MQRYLGIYPVANGEEDEVDWDNGPVLIIDEGFLVNIPSTFWCVSAAI